MPANNVLAWRRGRRPKASRERTRGMEGSVSALWGFDVSAWSAAAELMQLMGGGDPADG